MPSDSYEDLIFKLGDIAYERLWNKPNPPRAIERVLRAAETLEARQIELQEIEQAMDAEEAAYNEFRDACEAECAECREVIERHKKAVQVAESKAKALEAKLVTRRKDVAVARASIAKVEAQIKQWDESGEVEKAQASRAALKRAKLDLMKRARDCEEMQAEYDKIMNPQTGPGAEGIRARRREWDLGQQLEERTDAYNERITELNDQATAKDEAVKAARDYYERGLMILGEEVYSARLSDPALAPFYPKLDKLAG